MNVGVEVSSGVEVAEAKISHNFGVGFQWTNVKDARTTETVTRTTSVELKVSPCKKAACTVFQYQKRINAPYIETREIVFYDGTKHRFQIKGVVKGVAATDIEIK